MTERSSRIPSVATILCAATLSLVIAHADAAGDPPETKVKVDDTTFKCITDMTPVRHFYVDNLLGNVQGTVAVATVDRAIIPRARSCS